MVSLQAIGLFLDILGAGVITLPDIPRVRLLLESGKLREARRHIELDGLSEADNGYHTVLRRFNGLPFIEFDDPPDIFQAETVTQVGTSERILYGHYFVENQDQMENKKLSEVPFWVIRMDLDERIRQQEMRVRLLGFGLLATGFGLQLISVVLSTEGVEAELNNATQLVLSAFG